MDDRELLMRVRAVLLTTTDRWLRLSAYLPEELFKRPAAEGEWSAFDCLSHLMDTEMHIFPGRVSALLAGRDIPAFDPDTQGGDYSNLMPVQLATEFSRCRNENLPLISRVTPEDLQSSGVHSELGRVTLGQLLNEWAAHDLMHTVQAERALMQTFISNTGPWRIYFSDHDLDHTSVR